MGHQNQEKASKKEKKNWRGGRGNDFAFVCEVTSVTENCYPILGRVRWSGVH